jgi:hypothetical protein
MVLSLGFDAVPTMAPDQPDNPMLVLVSGILLLGAISLFISWGLSNAYPGG